MSVKSRVNTYCVNFSNYGVQTNKRQTDKNVEPCDYKSKKSKPFSTFAL